MKHPVHVLGYQGEPLAAVLKQLPGDARDVLLCGPFPGRGLADLVPWVYQPDVLDDWQDDGTYLGQEEDRAPTIALQRRSDSRPVRLRWSSAWFDTEPAADDAREAMQEMDRLLARLFRNPMLNMGNPVACGRHLLATTWSKRGMLTPPLEPEIRALLTEMSPQGRHECVTLPEVETLWRFVSYDMRLAYLWCCRRLPMGPVRRDRGDELVEEPAKYWVEFTPPEGWQHIGLLPVKQEGGGWAWPASGTWKTWADNRELELARNCGWSLRIKERLIFTPGEPMDAWVRGIQAALRETGNALVRTALRRIALNTIGSLHRSHVKRYRAAPKERKDMLPQGNPTLRLSRDGRFWFWRDEVPVTGRAAIYIHPEWSTSIWARCRARLAQAALKVPREALLALRQDAMFISQTMPDWKDDGAIGRFRLKQDTAGPLPAPRNLDELSALQALAGHAKGEADAGLPVPA